MNRLTCAKRYHKKTDQFLEKQFNFFLNDTMWNEFTEPTLIREDWNEGSKSYCIVVTAVYIFLDSLLFSDPIFKSLD